MSHERWNFEEQNNYYEQVIKNTLECNDLA